MVYGARIVSLFLLVLVVTASCGTETTSEPTAAEESTATTAPEPTTASDAVEPFITVEEPADGSTVTDATVTFRGTAPPGEEVRRDTSGVDPKTTANAEGRWEIAVKLEKPGPLEVRFFLQEHKDQRVTTTIVYTPEPQLGRAQAVAAPTWVVNEQRVGCHEKADATTKVVTEREPGWVLTMDQVVQQPDGTWHRDKDGKCWVRTEPGPIRVFTDYAAAQAHQATVRAQTPPVVATAAPTTSAVSTPTPPPAPAARGGRIPAQGTDCPQSHPIKGNQNSSGEWIYHSPGQQAYTRTQPEECFATAADAQAAGYRPAMR